MNERTQHLNALKDIRQMMEKSSRFISLSGFSGIAAGLCALAGAWVAAGVLKKSGANQSSDFSSETYRQAPSDALDLKNYTSPLFLIALCVLAAALLSGFLFTYLRSRKTSTPIWGAQAQRLLINVAVPMIAGGIYLLKVIDSGNYDLVAPGCLLFYGLSLLNASRYTLIEIRYLGYAEIILGLISLRFVGKGLLFWSIGFGILHIIYGVFMWWKYERSEVVN